MFGTYRGFADAATQPFEMVALKTPTSIATYRNQLSGAGFYPTGADLYGKDEHKLTIAASDDGTFGLHVFQSGMEKIGLRVQYEKGRIIDGRRTVHTQFDTLDEVMVCVGGYLKLAERHDAIEMPVRGETEIKPPRMRMR